MKWYFACNKDSDNFYPLIKAAVNSALKNTTLKPNFIFDGEPNELTAWLESKGVNVIYHRVEFYDTIYKSYSKKNWFTPLGAYLRCDIPIIEQEDDIVLYTDCDVIFLKDINENNAPKPELFACSSQFDKEDFCDFNTGVMFMNVKNLRKSYAEFKKYIEDNMQILDTYDQTAYQNFYGSKNTPLDIKYNHKPYWGVDKEAFIVHYHGPKPILFVSEDKIKNLHPIYYDLYKNAPESYDYYLELYKEFLPDINYDYEAIKLLKKGKYPLKKFIRNPLNIRIKNFIRKKTQKIKELLIDKS